MINTCNLNPFTSTMEISSIHLKQLTISRLRAIGESRALGGGGREM